MDNRTAAPRSTPPSTPPTSSADDSTDAAAENTAADGSAPESSATGSEPVAPSTTTASPARPTEADVELLSFAQQFELTARDLYDVAIDGAVAESEFVNVFRTLRENHEEYANAMSALLGVAAPQQRDDATFDQFSPVFGDADFAAVTDAAYELESAAVATHTEIVGRLAGVDGAQTLSALLLVESAHCTVLASVAGKDDDLAAMLDNDATSLAPASTAPEPTEPEATEPAADSEPADTEAADSEPADTEAADSEPAATEPAASATEGSTTETTEA